MDTVVRGIQEAVSEAILAIAADVTALEQGEEAKCMS
jgi:hypothetical protein